MNEGRLDHRHPVRRRQAGPGAVCLILMCGLGQVIAQTIDSASIAADVVLDDRYPARRHEFPDGVTGLADVVFATRVGYRPLTLDLYLPPGAGPSSEAHPLLVVIHGGGWESGHTRHFGAFSNWPAALAAIARDGFIVASVEYRLSREAPFPAAFDDVRDAIRWLRANAAQFGIDRSRAVAMGGSAGGQLAALAGTACGDRLNPVTSSDGDPSLVTESACVQGVVAWYGVFDFRPVICNADNGGEVPEVVARFLGCEAAGCHPETVRSASAIDWVDPSDPPFLLVHGTADSVVSVQQSRAMDNALGDVGVETTLIEIPGVKHSFIGSSPEATTEASRRAWDASIAFIRKVLREQPRDNRKNSG